MSRNDAQAFAFSLATHLDGCDRHLQDRRRHALHGPSNAKGDAEIVAEISPFAF